MRPLTESETKTLFEKLAKFIGSDLKLLLEDDQVFRLHNDRVYLVPTAMLRLSTNFPKDEVIALGTMFGKFTKKRNLKLTVHCLPILAKLAKYKAWVKPSSEMSFLYGHHVTKAGIERITDEVPRYGGVVVFNSSDLPLGFGVVAQDSEVVKSLESTGIVVLHQCDIGEYLRSESELN